MPPALYNCTKCIIVVFRYFTSDGRSRAILSFFPFCQTSVEVIYLLADAERGVFKAWEWVMAPPSDRAVAF